MLATIQAATSALPAITASVPPGSTGMTRVQEDVMAPPHNSVAQAIIDGAANVNFLAQRVPAILSSDTFAKMDVHQREQEEKRLVHLAAVSARMGYTLSLASLQKDDADAGSLTAAGPEMALMALSLEITKIIDALMQDRIADQRRRNILLVELNKCSDALRKIEAGPVDQIAKGLDEDVLGISLDAHAIARFEIATKKTLNDEKYQTARRYDAVAWRILNHHCLDRELKEIKRTLANYPTVDTIGSDDKGNILCYATRADKTLAQVVWFTYNGTTQNYIRGELSVDCYQAGRADNKISDEKCQRKLDRGPHTLADSLFAYGFYDRSEKLPTTREGVQTARELIATKVNTIDSDQTIKSADLAKFSQARNESYDSAIKINTRLFDSLNALVKQLGER